MKILVWQWGRRGAGPRFGACLADALRGRAGIEVALSLCRDAEIMHAPNPPRCEMPVRTYKGMLGFLIRLATAPLALGPLIWRLRGIRPDLAICAMPGPLDVIMALAVRLLGIRVVVVVHEAEAHPGDGFPGQMVLQRLLCRMANGVAYLCGHVGAQLARQGFRRLIPFEHPPFAFGVASSSRPCTADGGHIHPGQGRRDNGRLIFTTTNTKPPTAPSAHRPPRLLCFGRLLPYKGLDLLGEALRHVGGIDVRIVGSGPETDALHALRATHGVTVENRWVAENEIGGLLAWCDAVVLPYREASQSGVAAAAVAAGRPIIATAVGGLREQLYRVPNAILCQPDAPSLASALRRWIDAPPPDLPAIDTAHAWRGAVSDFLGAIQTTLPPVSSIPAERAIAWARLRSPPSPSAR